MIKTHSIIFFASGDFAVPTLKFLLENNYNVVGIVSSNDKVVFNDKRIVDLAIEYDVPYFLPKNLEDETFIQWLNDKDADIYCVISYKKLPDIVLKTAKLCAFNVHGSLLPFLRGAAPINWAIRIGLKETGMTAFILDDKIDCGRILSNAIVSINDNDTYGSLFARMSEQCVGFTMNVLNMLENNSDFYLRNAINQPSLPLFLKKKLSAPKINEKYFEKWDELSSTDFIRLLKSVSPFDGVPMNLKIYKRVYGKNFVEVEKVKSIRCKVYDAETIEIEGNIERLTDGKNYLYIELDNGSFVSIKEIQLDGRKRLDIKEFLRGFKYKTDDYFLTFETLKK